MRGVRVYGRFSEFAPNVSYSSILLCSAVCLWNMYSYTTED